MSAVLLTVWNGVAHADDGLRSAPAPDLVAINPVAVPIVDHGEMVGRLEVRAMWRAADPEAATDATARLPQLRASLVEAAAEHARLAAAPARAIDPEALAKGMVKAARAEGFSGDLLVLEASARRS